jgi:predicted ATPase
MDDLPHNRSLDARQSLQSIYAKFTEGFETEDIVSAKHLLDRGQVSGSR